MEIFFLVCALSVLLVSFVYTVYLFMHPFVNSFNIFDFGQLKKKIRLQLAQVSCVQIKF